MKIELILALLLLPIANAISDMTPPSIVSFDFEPKVVDVSQADQIIKFTAQIKDDLSGVDGQQMGSFKSPSGKQALLASFIAPDPTSHFSGDLVSGNVLNGTYVNNGTIPQYSESGEWHIVWFLLHDKVNNKQELNETEMKNLGFPTIIEVKS